MAHGLQPGLAAHHRASHLKASAREALFAALHRLDRVLEAACDAAERAYGSMAESDPYRGFYVSPQDFRRLLNRPPGVPLLYAESREPIDPANRTNPTDRVVPLDEGALVDATLPAADADRIDRPPCLSFAALQEAFGLSAFDLDALVIALAPEIDLRYQRLFAYLQDDVTRKRPSIDLTLNLLCPTAEAKLEGRRRFSSDAPLIWHHLVQLPQGQTTAVPFLARELEVDDAVVWALTGNPTLDRRLQPFAVCEWPPATAWAPIADPRLDALRRVADGNHDAGRPTLFHFQAPRGGGGRETAAALASALGRGLLSADLRLALGSDVDPGVAGALLLRDARLHDSILYIDGVDALRTTELQAKLVALLAQLRRALDVVIIASETPGAVLQDMLGPPGPDVVSVPFTLPGYEERLGCWREALGANGTKVTDDRNQIIAGNGDALVVEALADRFRLTTRQIRAAVTTARNQARLRAAEQTAASDRTPAAGRPTTADAHARVAQPNASNATLTDRPTVDELFAAARGQSTHSLGSLARQIHPKFKAKDLILPEDALAQLQEVCNQVRRRHVVYDAWGFGRKLSLGKGINVLFSGPPGVGKTMAAEVFAQELGLDLFKIDLSQIVSKYIGETEKNLNRVFDEARCSNAILFFDEADALFGKRSEVRDSHDRYANIEIAYLLQKMDEYEGLSVLATNLKQNLDEAFTRRLSFIIDFPFPDEQSRLRIWQTMWPADVPIGDDVDLAHLARTFRLSGGSIKNVAVAAAFLAAEKGEPIRTAHLVRATRRELQKMGKTVPEGDYSHVIPRTAAVFAS